MIVELHWEGYATPLIRIGEGPACTMTADEVEAQADHCNKKKKAAKNVEVSA